MKIYICNIDNISLSMTNKINLERQEKVKRLKKIEDKKRCIAGGLFIKKYIGNKQIVLNKYGKPYAENGQYFSISHSGKYIIFAISNFEVGCDIQHLSYINIKKASKIVFCKNEINQIENSFDKFTQFYKIWTKKESFLKCIGTGFSRESTSVDVSTNKFCDNGKDYFIKTYSFSNYMVAICTTDSKFPEYFIMEDFNNEHFK